MLILLLLSNLIDAAIEVLEDEDVNEELIELATAHNEREAEEAEERRILDVLRTSAEVSKSYSNYLLSTSTH